MAPLLVVALAGCAGGSVQPARSAGPNDPASPAGSASPVQFDAQYAQNRDKATDLARRLLGYAVIPPGAREQTQQPAALAFPPLGLPNAQTYADVAKYFRVPLAIDDAAAFVRSHPPAGFTEAGSVEGGSNHTIGYAWDGPNGDPSADGQLSMELAPLNSSSSYLRVDGGETFTDPRPIKDDQPGPRLRIEAAGHCPASDNAIVGVGNPGIDLSRQLAPAGTATSGLLCSYSGLNGNRQTLLTSRTLTAGEAGRLGRLARQVDLSHSDGERSCPMDDGTARLLMLGYPGRPAVNLWLRPRGCSSVSNGQVLAVGSASEAALLEATR